MILALAKYFFFVGPSRALCDRAATASGCESLLPELVLESESGVGGAWISWSPQSGLAHGAIVIPEGPRPETGNIWPRPWKIPT